MEAHTVTLVDPSPIMAAGLIEILQGHGIRVTHILAAELRSRLVHGSILVRTVGLDALGLLASLESTPRQTLSVLVTGRVTHATASAYLQTGARDVFPESVSGRELSDALRSPESPVARVPRRWAHASATGRSDDVDPLLPSDVVLLRQVARGAKVRDLADEVGYSERSMYRRLQHLYRCLGAVDRAGALLEAVKLGYLADAEVQVARVGPNTDATTVAP